MKDLRRDDRGKRSRCEYEDRIPAFAGMTEKTGTTEGKEAGMTKGRAFLKAKA